MRSQILTFISPALRVVAVHGSRTDLEARSLDATESETDPPAAVIAALTVAGVSLAAGGGGGGDGTAAACAVRPRPPRPGALDVDRNRNGERGRPLRTSTSPTLTSGRC